MNLLEEWIKPGNRKARKMLSNSIILMILFLNSMSLESKKMMTFRIEFRWKKDKNYYIIWTNIKIERKSNKNYSRPRKILFMRWNM